MSRAQEGDQIKNEHGIENFIMQFRPSGNYEHNPEDFQELYELVKKVAS